MEIDYDIPEPFQFNKMKHHLSFIKEFISLRQSEDKAPEINSLVKEIKHIGTSVMDIYTGSLTLRKIIDEIGFILNSNNLGDESAYSGWIGKTYNDFRIISLSDNSQWMLKYKDDRNRYVHLFPARTSPHTIRVKANTLKSAIMYTIIIGKDFISGKDLNHARDIQGLSPIKDTPDVEAITEMIEILRS
jgi:hypothetical protein